MRYSASEKLEIIELIEQSTLSVDRNLASIGIPRSTFYDWDVDTRTVGSRLWKTASPDRSGLEQDPR